MSIVTPMYISMRIFVNDFRNEMVSLVAKFFQCDVQTEINNAEWTMNSVVISKNIFDYLKSKGIKTEDICEYAAIDPSLDPSRIFEEMKANYDGRYLQERTCRITHSVNLQELYDTLMPIIPRNRRLTIPDSDFVRMYDDREQNTDFTGLDVERMYSCAFDNFIDSQFEEAIPLVYLMKKFPNQIYGIRNSNLDDLFCMKMFCLFCFTMGIRFEYYKTQELCYRYPSLFITAIQYFPEIFDCYETSIVSLILESFSCEDHGDMLSVQDIKMLLTTHPMTHMNYNLLLQIQNNIDRYESHLSFEDTVIYHMYHLGDRSKARFDLDRQDLDNCPHFNISKWKKEILEMIDSPRLLFSVDIVPFTPGIGTCMNLSKSFGSSFIETFEVYDRNDIFDFGVNSKITMLNFKELTPLIKKYFVVTER